MSNVLKNRSGFSLMEVLLTMALVAVVGTPIMIQQSALMRGVDRASRLAMMIQVAQLFLYETEVSLQPGTVAHEVRKKLDDAYETELHFKRTAVAAQSAYGNFSNIVQDQVVCSWMESGQKRQETLIFFLYQLPLPEKKT